MDAADELPIDEMPLDDECDAVDLVAESYFEAMERNDRAWIRTILPILQSASKERPENVGYTVGKVYEDMLIAACERAARIFRSDVPPDET